MEEIYNKAIAYACSDNTDLFLQLISANPELVKYKDEFGSNLLMEIIHDIDVSIIQKLIDMQSDINLLDGEGITAMHTLIRDGKGRYLEKIQLLLDSGFDLEIAGYNGWKPLHKAVFYNCYDIIKLLLENGADINSRTELDNEKTALMLAAFNNNLRMVKTLVEYGADVNLKDAFARTAKDYTGCIFGWRVESYLMSVMQ